MTGPHLAWQDCSESCSSFANFRGLLRYRRTLWSFRGELRTLFWEAAWKQLSCGGKVCIVIWFILACSHIITLSKIYSVQFRMRRPIEAIEVFPNQSAQPTCLGTGEFWSESCMVTVTQNLRHGPNGIVPNSATKPHLVWLFVNLSFLLCSEPRLQVKWIDKFLSSTYARASLHGMIILYKKSTF